MKAFIWLVIIAGAIALGYYLLVVVPRRDDCVAKAQQTYSVATVDYQAQLISASAYQQAGDDLQSQLAACNS